VEQRQQHTLPLHTPETLFSLHHIYNPPFLTSTPPTTTSLSFKALAWVNSQLNGNFSGNFNSTSPSTGNDNEPYATSPPPPLLRIVPVLFNLGASYFDSCFF
jgi:hypothetical protein